MQRLFFFCCLGWLLTACRTPTPAPVALSRFEYAGPHMGTMWRITVYAPDRPTASNAVTRAFARVTALDQMMTDYDPESELMRLCHSPPGVPIKVSEDLFRVLRFAQEVSDRSQGAFDVTVGPEVQLWRRARRQEALPAADRLAAARQAVGYQKLRLNRRERTVTLLAEHMRLDLGGIGKGYGADEALRVLRTNGLSRALVAASGDLAIGDPPPGKAGWRVGVGRPGGTPKDQLGTLLLHNAGISTSGDTEQFVELEGVRYSHIVDPRTGWALTNRFQTTVLADCATRSDSLTKTMCVLGPTAGLKLIERDSRASALVVVPGAGTNWVSLPSRRFPAWSLSRE